MNSTRWNVIGVIGVLLLASLWIGWGLSVAGQRVVEVRHDLLGAWTVTELSGELPEPSRSVGAVVTRVELDDALGDVRVHVFVESGGSEYEAGAFSLAPVVGDATAWDAPTFRIVLRSTEEIELTELPVDGVTSSPPWHARGQRRKP